MILQILRSHFAVALNTLVEDTDSYLEMIRPSQDPKFGDCQANMAMPLAKQLSSDCTPPPIPLQDTLCFWELPI
jgi:arginyl-tRNA synthetase